MDPEPEFDPQNQFVSDPCLEDQSDSDPIDMDDIGAHVTQQSIIEAELREFQEAIRLQEEEEAYQSALNDPLYAHLFEDLEEDPLAEPPLQL